MVSKSISPSDPTVILAGIKQFGLAPDGSDLQDLKSAIIRLQEDDKISREFLEVADRNNARLRAERDEAMEALRWLYAIVLKDGLMPPMVSYMENAERVLAKHPKAPACPYCGTTEGLRIANPVAVAAAYETTDYICEACFTPSDTGPGFDDLPFAK